jgi:hypothetical protein
MAAAVSVSERFAGAIAMSDLINGWVAVPAAGQWKPLREAAALLGCSPREVRRMVASGQLPVKTDSGGKRSVFVETANGQLDAPGSLRPTSPSKVRRAS